MPFDLLTGGVRAGKSRIAASLAARSDAEVTVVATATAGDEEMAARIEQHRRERPARWEVVEEPTEVAAALGQIDPSRFCLLDCLTLWVSNLADRSHGEVLERVRRVAGILADRPGPGAVVTNEVGWGIVPVEAATRRYRDLLGDVNQVFADRAERVWLVAAGRAVGLEPIDG